jgi:hypothetical protein
VAIAKLDSRLLGLAGVVLASPVTQRLADYLSHQPSLCPLQRITGMACPSCGGTRAGLYVLSGDLVSAIKVNAGVTLFLIVVAGLTATGHVVPAQVLGVANPYKRVAD